MWNKVLIILSIFQFGVISFLSHRKMDAAGNEEGILKWMESGNKGDKWWEASVHIKHDEDFWVRKSYKWRVLMI